MRIITSRAEVNPIIKEAIVIYERSGLDAFISVTHNTILKQKIRYPLLEYVAQKFHDSIPENKHVEVTDRIIALKENGGDVIAGKILQLRLEKYYKESIEKAVEYILSGANWLSCDTVGERVLGHALLTTPERTLSVLRKLSQNDDKWIVRSVGVATHYAVKKGLLKVYVDQMFSILLSLANTTDFHTKKGVGWAAKTISKFHPEIIETYDEAVNNNPEVKQWFRTKIKIGLGRTYKYAHRYTS